MRKDKFALSKMRLTDYLQNDFKNMRRTFPLTAFLALLICCSFGCAPSNSAGDTAQNSAASTDIPELSDEIIRERINDTGVWDVPEENGKGEPISWRFDEDEPKEIAVVERKIDGTRATIVLDIKTRSAPGWRNPRALAGQIRTEWKLETGWALRQWEIKRTENISMKYKNLPKPDAQNSNR